MRLERLQMSNGDSYAILLDDTGMPLPYPNLFVTLQHRDSSDTTNTCIAVFERIRYLIEICEFLKIDLIQRCIEGNFIQENEIRSLIKWAKYKVHTFRKHVIEQKSQKIVSLTPKLKKLENVRAVFVLNHEGDISPHTAYNRLTTFAEYIGWLETKLHPSKDSTSEFTIKSLRPEKFGTSDEKLDWGEYRSLTPTQLVRVLDVVRPDSKENPWKKEAIRYRNQLIVNMYDATASRRGELLKVRVLTDLKKGDVKINPKNGIRYVTIRSKVDLDDIRKNRPEAKTVGRHIPMDKRLSEMYDNYLIYHRHKAIGHQNIPYLFITHDNNKKGNRALSLSQVNKIFREISKVVGFAVSPHSLRHTWNDRFSKYADKRIAENKTTEAKADSDQRKLAGWTANSKEIGRYTKRTRDNRAMMVGLELQEKHSSEVSKIVGQYDEDLPF